MDLQSSLYSINNQRMQHHYSTLEVGLMDKVSNHISYVIDVTLYIFRFNVLINKNKFTFFGSTFIFSFLDSQPKFLNFIKFLNFY